MGSLNFYYKNCPQAAKESIRDVLVQKIINLAEKDEWKEGEDVLEYLEFEALP